MQDSRVIPAVRGRRLCCFCAWRTAKAANGLDFISMLLGCDERLWGEEAILKKEVENGDDSVALADGEEYNPDVEPVVYLDGVEEWRVDESFYLLEPSVWQFIRPFTLFFLDDCNVKFGSAVRKEMASHSHQNFCLWHVVGGWSHESALIQKRKSQMVWLKLPMAGSSAFEQFVCKVFGCQFHRSKCYTVCGSGSVTCVKARPGDGRLSSMVRLGSIFQGSGQLHGTSSQCVLQNLFPWCVGTEVVPALTATSDEYGTETLPEVRDGSCCNHVVTPKEEVEVEEVKHCWMDVRTEDNVSWIEEPAPEVHLKRGSNTVLKCPGCSCLFFENKSGFASLSHHIMSCHRRQARYLRLTVRQWWYRYCSSRTSHQGGSSSDSEYKL